MIRGRGPTRPPGWRPRALGRRGLSLMEILFSLLVFGVVLGLLSRNLRVANLSQDLMGKLDVLQRLRLAELRLRQEISTGVAVLYPREDDTTPRNALVWAGERNELRLLWLADDGSLRVRVRGEDPRVLCRGISALSVSQPVRGEVECSVTARNDEGREVSVVFSGFVGNHFLGEGRAP